jgi:ribosomal protein L11 methyltransferase
MKWIEARVDYTASGGLLCADVIADLFYDMGLKGVLLDQPDMRFDPDGSSARQPAVIGYLPDSDTSRRHCETLRQRLRHMRFPAELAMRVIDDQDWEQVWKSHFTPVTVCPGLIITPSWEKNPAGEAETIVEIDPGMAFGTGHHPTTLLCLQMIRKYLQNGDTLLDVGTGTGILAITAVKSGSGAVVAVDSDETAIAVAQENRRRNRIGANQLGLLCGDLVEPVKGHFHLVVANILPHVILELLDQLDRVLIPGGVFIASGIPDEKAEAVIAEATGRSMETALVQSLDGWTAFVGRCRK